MFEQQHTKKGKYVSIAFVRVRIVFHQKKFESKVVTTTWILTVWKMSFQFLSSPTIISTEKFEYIKCFNVNHFTTALA